MTTILTVTLNPALDVCAEVPVVEPDHKLHCVQADRTPGGGGINVARAVVRLGGWATALFPYGGSSGGHLRDLLHEEGVPTAAIPATGTTREDFSVRETGTGHEYRFVLPGPPLLPAEVAACIDETVRLVHERSYVVISGSMPPGVDDDVLRRLVEQLHVTRAKLVVDTSGPPLATFAGLGVFLLKPSLNELQGYAGRALTSLEEIVDAADDLRRRGPNHAVVVSLGADGAVLVTDFAPPCAITVPPVPVISTVGAGDSLVAGLVLGLASGERLVNATRRGVAAGSAATIAAGHHLCRPADVAAILADVESSPVLRRQTVS